MDRYAIFLDAGYFFAAGAQEIAGNKIPRRNIRLVDAQQTINQLCNFAQKIASNLGLLRVYWYDAMMGARPSLEQSTLALLNSVKLRFGSLNASGEQKGVDSLIVTDLIELARNRAISEAVVVSGDEDLRIAVQLAQSFGVRVHVLAVGNALRNVSPSLRMEADSISAFDSEWLASQLVVTSKDAPVIEQVRKETFESSDPASLERKAQAVSTGLLRDVENDTLKSLSLSLKANSTIPPEFDRKLIAKTSDAMQRQLTSAEKRKIRGVFVVTLRRHLL
jgi:uncharacterized LabA/DUF88 family protein